ncbi:MAG TPA: CdaR family protein, partial [Anaerolineae bacterium]|nr:CdaR family protein [Anaerolineae bacterium]
MKAWRSLAASASSVLLALFLAIVVWVVATYETAPPRTGTFPTPIPIRLINLGKDLIIRSPERPETDVRIRALSDAWGQLGIRSFEATADLEGLGDGQHEVPVSVETLEEGIDILGVDPSRITVNLEQEVERSVHVSVVLLDEKTIPRGYVSQLPVVTPEQITIRGPRTVVSQVLEAVMELSLNNARDTVTKQEAPALLDANGNQIQGLTISPSTVRVTVPIQRLLGYRDVTVRATTQGTPAPGYWISSIGVEPALVTVYGE